MVDRQHAEFPAESSEVVETDELNSLLNEITARCDQQTKEINKWLLYSKDFKLLIDNLLEQERLRREASTSVHIPMTPMTPRMPGSFF